MAAKVVTAISNIQTETVAQSMTISRGYKGGYPNNSPSQDLTPFYNVSMIYVENEFLLDPEGNRNRILSQGQNMKGITLSPEKVGIFFMKLITVDGVETTLGEFLANLMDAEILEDLNKVVEPPILP